MAGSQIAETDCYIHADITVEDIKKEPFEITVFGEEIIFEDGEEEQVGKLMCGDELRDDTDKSLHVYLPSPFAEDIKEEPLEDIEIEDSKNCTNNIINKYNHGNHFRKVESSQYHTKSRHSIAPSEEVDSPLDIEEETDDPNEEFNMINIKLENEYHNKVVPGPSTPVDKIQCNVCTKTFTTRWYLNRHMKETCKGKIDYSFNFIVQGLKCDECGREFTLKQSLKRHKMKNLCKGKGSYFPIIKIKGKKCDECGKEFAFNQSLQRHVMRNLCKAGKVDPLAKTFKCDECEKTFGLKQSLQRHQLIHNGQYPYWCYECGRGFARAGPLSRHAKSKHNIELSVEMNCNDVRSNESKEYKSLIKNEGDNLTNEGFVNIGQSENYKYQRNYSTSDDNSNIVTQEEDVEGKF